VKYTFVKGEIPGIWRQFCTTCDKRQHFVMLYSRPALWIGIRRQRDRGKHTTNA
jgi:hypothetical protein